MEDRTYFSYYMYFILPIDLVKLSTLWDLRLCKGLNFYTFLSFKATHQKMSCTNPLQPASPEISKNGIYSDARTTDGYF
jgi:hypothetical protein